MRAVAIGSRSAFSHASNSDVRKNVLMRECIRIDTKNQAASKRGARSDRLNTRIYLERKTSYMLTELSDPWPCMSIGRMQPCSVGYHD